MDITAVFTGADNSLGYKNGRMYTLKVSVKNKIAIERKDGSGFCNYNSLELFLQNWDKINTLK